jgi:uncharacterized repeat protein (TIGR03803 family)
MAELVDALVSGTSGGNTVGVRVPFWAVLLCAVAFASCARANDASPVPAPFSVDAGREANGYALLYDFKGKSSGSGPTGLTELGGAFYGTTTAGGAKTFGTAFVRSARGNVHLLYSFRGPDDGATPQGSLVADNGALYGTTEFGGKSGDGTIFEITTAGKERVVYAFKGGRDGATPVLAGLVVMGGTLYGTTSAGGDSSCHVENSVGCGTIFAVTPSGKERVLYRFKGKPDGASPSGSLIALGGTLYGTTNFGGPGDNGTVFSAGTSGSQRVIYAFKGFPDGAVPYAGLTPLNGAFYGTTSFGGAFNYSGTVFKVSATGTERVIHSFQGYPDGAVPLGSLIVYKGELYGTTEYGGNSSRACVGGAIVGCGTIFAIGTSGNERVLYRFRGVPDGLLPWTGLVLSNGVFYGTTLSGGADDAGTIFKFMPAAR